MATTYAERHLKALQLAKSCVDLGARIRTVAYVTGLAHKELMGIFFTDGVPIPRGRAPDSPEWYHQANLIERAEASLFAAIFSYMGGAGCGHGDALISAYTMYLERCSMEPRVSFDRAFDIACHLKGIWVHRHPHFELGVCLRCGSKYLAALGDRSSDNGGCLFCKLVKRYPNDKRIQTTFPASAIRLEAARHFGLLTAFRFNSETFRKNGKIPAGLAGEK